MNLFSKSLKLSALSLALPVSMLLASSSAMAFDTQDRATLEQQIKQISQSTEDLNFDRVLSMMPPKVLAYFAQKTGLPVASVKQMLAEQTKQVVADLAKDNMKISYMADLNHAKIHQSKLGHDYLIIPTEFDMMNDDTGMEMTGTLLAIKDEGQWYLMRLDGQSHLDIIKDIYPDLTELSLFEPTVNYYEPGED